MKESPNKTPRLQQSPTEDDFNGSFMHIIHQLYFSIQKHLEQTLLTKKELSFSQFIILVGFSCQSDMPITQAKLAEHLMLTEATVSRHITILVTKKYLSKEKDTNNKKSYHLTLTPLGKSAFDRTKKIIAKELDVCFSHISSKDRNNSIKNFTKTIALLHAKK